MKSETLGLAAFASTQQYVPQIRDFVIWAGMFRTWYGVVNGYDPKSQIVSIVFEGSPRLLFTSAGDEITECTRQIRLSTIRLQKRGSWSIQQVTNGNPCWLI